MKIKGSVPDVVEARSFKLNDQDTENIDGTKCSNCNEDCFQEPMLL